MSETSSDGSPKQTRLMIHSTPRSSGVILTKCLSGIPDSEVFLEPHYFCHEAANHLKEMGKLEDAEADRLPKEELFKVASLVAGEDCSHAVVDYDLITYPKMMRALESPNEGKRLILSKCVSTGFEGNFDHLPSMSSNYHHIFIIRHPVRVLLSWRKMLYDMGTTVLASQSGDIKSFEEFHFTRDGPKKYVRVGFLFQELYDLWVYIRKNLEPNPIVIDSDDLMSNPAGILSKLCAATGLPYSDALLSWDADPAKTDDWRCMFRPFRSFQFGRASLQEAYYTSGFQPEKPLPSMDELPVDVREGVEAVMPRYTEMYENRILP